MTNTYPVATHIVAGLAIVAIVGFTQAQTPKPLSIEEQVRIYNSLPSEQQRKLISELEQNPNIPPAQREAIIRVLQGGDPNSNGRSR